MRFSLGDTDPEKLELRMDRFFTKLQPDKLVFRNNYGFQVIADLSESKNPHEDVDPEELHWSTTDFGDEGELPCPESHSSDSKCTSATFVHGTHPSVAPVKHLRPRPDQIYFRSERQSLRRMPRTGAILFTIRTYYESVTKLAEEPGIPGRMASAIRSWPQDVAA